MSPIDETPPFPDDSIATSLTLLQRVKDGDEKSWSRFVDCYGPLVYWWCRKMQIKPGDVADIVQDVFVAVFENIDRFRREDPKHDSLRGWMWTITKNKVVDLRRKDCTVQVVGGSANQMRVHQVADDVVESTSTYPPAKRPEHPAVTIVRLSVAEDTWQAFAMVKQENRAVVHVAEELGKSVRAVYKAVERVSSRLIEEKKRIDEEIERFKSKIQEDLDETD